MVWSLLERYGPKFENVKLRKIKTNKIKESAKNCKEKYLI